MPNESPSLLISDVFPRTAGYSRKTATFTQRRRSNLVRFPDAPSTPFAPQPHQHTDGSSAHSSFYGALKYLGVFAVVIAALTFLVGSRISNLLQPTIEAAPLYSQAEAKPQKVNYGLPARLRIPKIKVDAAVEHAGLTPDGEVGVPKNPQDVSWFNAGPRPGEIGSSVIVGHYGWVNSTPAVFDKLNKLQEGDGIQIEDEKGTTITFVVRELRTYGANDKAADVFRSNDGKGHLTLITCQGAWNKTQKSYSNRLAVFADKIAS